MLVIVYWFKLKGPVIKLMTLNRAMVNPTIVSLILFLTITSLTIECTDAKINNSFVKTTTAFTSPFPSRHGINTREPRSQGRNVLSRSTKTNVRLVGSENDYRPNHYRHKAYPNDDRNPRQKFWRKSCSLASSRLFRQEHPSSTSSFTSLIRNKNPLSRTSKSKTRLNMVLTTPESIIEQISTQKLLDDLIDESVRTNARKPIMMQFDPSSGWIWRRWKGTVFSETWTSCIRNMTYALVVTMLYKIRPNIWESFTGFSILWGQLLSITTFTLTFFLNQSYALWRKCYELSRRLQGRLNDLGMAMAAYAERTNPDDISEPSTYTAGSRQVLELTGRYIRVFNMLTYASFTSSHRPILTPRGMRRLVDRGIITSKERQILSDAQLPVTQRHNAILLWIMRIFLEGRKSGYILGGDGFEQQFLEKCHVIRAQYGAIGDELQGRMPLAYAHIVQVLVDVILWMYPFMAFSTGMSPLLGVLGTGLLTMFYQGLFDLAKQFLDPYDNESYGKGEDPLCVDTLVAETNSGSVRWMNSFEYQPFSSKLLEEGELQMESILPLRGYSVEDLKKIEDTAELGTEFA